MILLYRGMDSCSLLENIFQIHDSCCMVEDNTLLYYKEKGLQRVRQAPRLLKVYALYFFSNEIQWEQRKEDEREVSAVSK